MEIILGKTAGFCEGVASSVEQAMKLLSINSGGIYCLGELVHNKEVMKNLQDEGLIVIDDITKAQGDVVFRAHGVSKKIYEIAKKNNIKVNDLTCKKVLFVHDIAEEYAKKGYYVILIGEKDHPEVIGTKSFCGENCTVIESKDEIINIVEEFKNSKIKRLAIISQTTFNAEKFDEIVKIIRQMLGNNVEVNVRNTICRATKIRQEETKRIASDVDYMIIIGGQESSNTNKLYDIACESCKNVVFIQTKEGLNIDEIKKYKKIGIMAGASTSKIVIDGVMELLKNQTNLSTL